MSGYKQVVRSSLATITVNGEPARTDECLAYHSAALVLHWQRMNAGRADARAPGFAGELYHYGHIAHHEDRVKALRLCTKEFWQ